MGKSEPLAKEAEMAVHDDEGDAQDFDADFLDQSYLTYFIPAATQFAPEDAVRAVDVSKQSCSEGLEQREWLFFDETVDVHLVLRTPRVDEATLRSYLRRVDVSLETQIVNCHAPDRESPPASETIYTDTVGDKAEPTIVLGDAAKDTAEQHAYAVWKLAVFMTRPRMRLQGPSVVFSSMATVRPAKPGDSDAAVSGYMQSRVPTGMNLLEAFASDASLRGVKPRLSAFRISSVAPVTRVDERHRALRGLQSLRMNIYPAVHARVRFSRPNATPPSPALVALLELDFTPFFECEVRLEQIALSVNDGTVEHLTDQDGMRPPLMCVAYDHITFLYRLAPNQLDMASKNPTRELDIAIEVTALIRPEGPPRCVPRLRMAWSTTVDFTLPLNPGFGQLVHPPIQRPNRPRQLSIGDTQSLVPPSVSRPDSIPSLEAGGFETSLPELGITMTFTGPREPVYVGEEFQWSVFVVNRSRADGPPAASPGFSRPGGLLSSSASSATAGSSSRKLALLAMPKRRRNEMRVMRPPSTPIGVGGVAGGKRDGLVADAVVDDKVVHAMQHSSAVDATDVVCLSADVRVGPLAANACAVAELRFLALRAGVVGVEAVRVVDLGNQEHVDVRELPLVVVREREKPTR